MTDRASAITSAALAVIIGAVSTLGLYYLGIAVAHADTGSGSAAGSGSATLPAAGGGGSGSALPPAAALVAPAAAEPPAAAVLPAPVVASPATPAAKADANPLGTIGELLHAVKTGDYRMAAALALALLMAGLGKVRGRIKWFAGDRGGAVLAAVLGFAGALSTALAAGAAIDLRLFTTAAQVTLIAVGGYTWLMRVWRPADKKA